MPDPISGTGLAGGVLTGASVYELLTGTDYGVVFGAFGGLRYLPVVFRYPQFCFLWG